MLRTKEYGSLFCPCFAYEAESGSLGYIYLNGLLIEWLESPDMVGVSKRVSERGSELDHIFNTNDTLTISALSAGSLDVSGSNTR